MSPPALCISEIKKCTKSCFHREMISDSLNAELQLPVCFSQTSYLFAAALLRPTLNCGQAIQDSVTTCFYISGFVHDWLGIKASNKKYANVRCAFQVQNTQWNWDNKKSSHTCLRNTRAQNNIGEKSIPHNLPDLKFTLTAES